MHSKMMLKLENSSFISEIFQALSLHLSTQSIQAISIYIYIHDLRVLNSKSIAQYQLQQSPRLRKYIQALILLHTLPLFGSSPQPFCLQFQPQRATRAISHWGASNIFSDNAIDTTETTPKDTGEQKAQNTQKTQHFYTRKNRFKMPEVATFHFHVGLLRRQPLYNYNV